tara:strand:+ start:2432 stop:3139 length:708 start_codon:yes stop_codon:yes gene_type:complete
MNLKIDKIFCCHHPSRALAPRKERLFDFFTKHDLDVEWVTDFTPTDAKKFDYDTLLHNVVTKGPQDCRGWDTKAQKNAQDLCLKSISLILKHNYCYEQQLEHNYENILILEDDVNLEGVFSELYFNKCMDEYREQHLEMLFLGSCCNLNYPQTHPTQYVYYDPSLRTRCTHCYITSRAAAARIIRHCYKMRDSVDWQLNWIIETEKIKTGWAEPSVPQFNYGSTLNPEGDTSCEN